jgi:hypothetical protein
MSDMRVFTYRIDAGDRISHVSPEWLEFAVENGAEQLARPGLVGKPLWPFIAGLETQHLYDVILKKVRAASAVIGFSYRCDAPHLRRYMKMVVRPWEASGVEFSSRVESEAPREPVSLLATTAARSDQVIRMCGWCKRVAMPEWVEVEEAIRQLRLFEQDYMPQITHTLCPECEKQVRAAIP